MPTMADMEREDRLKGLWDALVKQLPSNMQTSEQFTSRDPMAAATALQGGYGRNADPYMALRFLQLGQAMQGGGGNDMLTQLIQSLLQQQPKR